MRFNKSKKILLSMVKIIKEDEIMKYTNSIFTDKILFMF